MSVSFREVGEKNNGREMSVTELSQALNVSEDKICEALSAGSSPLSLNADYEMCIRDRCYWVYL